MNMCVLSLVSFYLYQLERRRGTWLLSLYVSPGCRCIMTVPLGHGLNFATGCTCEQESSSHVPQPGLRPQVPGLGSSGPARGSPETEQLEKGKKNKTEIGKAKRELHT